MKHIFLSLLALSLLVACHGGGGGVDEGRTYQVSASLEVDSTIVLDHLMLYADSHVGLRADSLIASPQHTLQYEGRTVSLDELYLCSEGGELCRFYAGGGMQVDFTLRSEGGTLTADFTESEGDTINPWLRRHTAELGRMGAADRLRSIDALCHQHPADVRCALLLRDEVESVGDSIGVRRCLGALTDEAKPEWLLSSINQLLAETAPYLQRNRRLSNIKLQVNDSVNFDMSASRSDYLLIYCWADYDPTSLDSLQVLQSLLEEDYDMKRLRMLSLCVGAPDSIWWRRHRGEAKEQRLDALLPAGLSDQRVRQWRITQVPALILVDMYGNQQQRDVWGADLRKALDRVPNKSGFAHTPKPKPVNSNRPKPVIKKSNGR